jgi:hypothetical protein
VALVAAPLAFALASTTPAISTAGAESALCATPQPHETNGSLEQPAVTATQAGVFASAQAKPWVGGPTDSVRIARGPYQGVVAYDGVQFGLVDSANGEGITVSSIGNGKTVEVNLAAKAITTPAALHVAARHSGDTVQLGAPIVAANGPDRGGWTVLTFTDTNTSANPTTFFFTAPGASPAIAIDDVQVRPVAAACNDLTSVDSGDTIDVPVLANDLGARTAVSGVGTPLPSNGLTASLFPDHLHLASVAGTTGTFAVPYTITDAAGNHSDAAVTVVVRPLAVNDLANVAVDSGSVSIGVLSNDLGPSKSIVSVQDPVHGVATINGDDIDYTPDQSYAGLDTFRYTMMSDGFESTATVTVRVSLSAGLSVSAGTTAPTSPLAGAPFTVPFAVLNAGPSSALTPVLTLNVPAGVTFVSGPGCVAGPPVQCTLPAATSLTGGGVTTFRPVLRATNSGSVSIGATVSSTTPDPNPADNTATAHVTVVPSADVLVANTAIVTSPVTPGSPISWTSDLANAGPSVAKSTVAVFRFPSGLVSSVDAAVSGGPAVACSPVSNTLVCPFGNLNAGAFRTVVLTGDVSPGATLDDLVFESSVTSGVADLNPANNDQVVSAGALPQADLTVAASLTSSSPLTPGDAALYSIVTTNHGRDAADGTTLVVALPAGLSVGTAPSGCALSASTLACQFGSLASGGSRTVHMSATVTPDPPPGNVVVTATAKAATPDPTPANAVATVATPVARQADLGVHLSVVPNSPAVGVNAVLFAMVTNSGPSTATNVATSITVPAGFTTVSVDASCTNGAPVTCAVPSIPADGARALAITGEWLVAPSTPQVFTATTAAAEPDPVAANDSDTLHVTPIVRSDLSVAGALDHLPVAPKQANAYRLAVSNGGSSPAGAGSTLDLQVSAGITVGVLPVGCIKSSTVVTCTLGPIAVGDTTSLVIPFTPGGAVPMPLVAIATVHVPGDVTDPDPTNDQFMISDALRNAADIVLHEKDPDTAATPGATAVVFFTIENHGPADVSNTKFKVFVPQNDGFVSASGASCFETTILAAVQCSAGPLASGHQITVAITVSVSLLPPPPPPPPLGDTKPGIVENPIGPIAGPATNAEIEQVFAIAYDPSINDFDLTNNLGIVQLSRP